MNYTIISLRHWKSPSKTLFMHIRVFIKGTDEYKKNIIVTIIFYFVVSNTLKCYKFICMLKNDCLQSLAKNNHNQLQRFWKEKIYEFCDDLRKDSLTYKNSSDLCCVFYYVLRQVVNCRLDAVYSHLGQRRRGPWW